MGSGTLLSGVESVRKPLDPGRSAQPDMKDIVNTKIKIPRALSSVCAVSPRRKARRIFRAAERDELVSSALYAVRCARTRRAEEDSAGITHVDGTGRLQTVFKAQSPRYYKMIEKFGQATGVPVVMKHLVQLEG